MRVAAGLVSFGVLALSVPAPASAEGIFESIFGGLRRSVEAPRAPTNIQSFADPSADAGVINVPAERTAGGPAAAYCVRSCDGSYFPVRAQAGLSAAEACHSFCPGSQTRLYSGSSIDAAVATNGSRYVDLPNAYVYRKQLVAGCTCNGRDAFGLARIDATSDPTLRPGDVVATKNGLVAFAGGKNRTAGFTPVGTYPGLSRSDRNKLSELRISGPVPTVPVMVTLPAETRATVGHSAQLEK